MEQEKKEAHFVNLIKLAASDDQISDEEKTILFKAAQRFGISPARATAIVAEIDNIPFEVPESSVIRKAELKECIELIKADGVIDLPEVALLHEIGKKLGFSVGQIDQAIKGVDPGEPSKIVLNSQTRRAIEIAICAACVAAALIGTTMSENYLTGISKVEAGQSDVNREIAEMLEKENALEKPLETVREALKDAEMKFHEVDSRLRSVREIKNILKDSL